MIWAIERNICGSNNLYQYIIKHGGVVHPLHPKPVAADVMYNASSIPIY
jgi:hypothetical protein